MGQCISKIRSMFYKGASPIVGNFIHSNNEYITAYNGVVFGAERVAYESRPPENHQGEAQPGESHQLTGFSTTTVISPPTRDSTEHPDMHESQTRLVPELTNIEAGTPSMISGSFQSEEDLHGGENKPSLNIVSCNPYYSFVSTNIHVNHPARPSH